MQASCEATTLAGEPCLAPPLDGKRFCVAHEPGLTAERTAWRVAGGATHATPQGNSHAMRDPDAALEIIELATGGALAMRGGGERVRALLSCAKACLDALRETSNEQRIHALEKQIAELAAKR